MHCRQASTSTAAPPMLQRIRSDLKTALKAKDTNRLNVLRSLLAETTNLAKTSNPITTDVQLLSLLRKRSAASRTAAAEFDGAGRADLRDKEEAQVAVLEEYAGGVETVGLEEIGRVVGGEIERLRADGCRVDVGGVLKGVLGEGGLLAGKPVERGDVARLVKEVLGSKA
ncbi:MAG: hypothetical protein M1832_002179 [Thelocarpon impressellum]|nr:MAG: hypothetical protein M1832_002179 [Thelocarpon impressellum]